MSVVDGISTDPIFSVDAVGASGDHGAGWLGAEDVSVVFVGGVAVLVGVTFGVGVGVGVCGSIVFLWQLL